MMLQKGSTGSTVKEVQNLLMNKGYSLPRYGADGSYGDETTSAVANFQKDMNLPITGMVDDETYDFLKGSLAVQETAVTKQPSKIMTTIKANWKSIGLGVVALSVLIFLKSKKRK